MIRWLWVAAVLAATSASAQVPPEIPLLPRLGTGARALGMGGAYSAVAEDYTALSYNPAGLAQVRRVEFGGAFDFRSVDQDVTYLGTLESTPLNKSGIQSIGFAYPFPTYRGSMVIAFSYDRLTPIDTDYFRTGEGNGVAFEEESIQEDGSLSAWQAGFATDVSRNLSLGATAAILTGNSLRERSFDYEGTNNFDYERTRTTTDMDISALTGRLGALVRISPALRLGLALHLPEHLDLEGTIDDDVIRYEDVPRDTLDYVESYGFQDDLDLPVKLAAGLAFAPTGGLRGLLLSGDVTYTDWQQIDYAGPIRLDNRRYAYRPTTDIRFGAEYAFPQVPLRLRAGYISQPLAYRPMVTNVFTGEYQREATLDQDRRYFTLGGGILIDQSLTLDLAFVTGGYERSGRSEAGVTREKVKDQRMVVGAAFRL